MRLVRVLPLFLLLVSMGCAAGRNPLTIERPNARTLLEERAYNLMLTSETLLNTATRCDTNLEDGCEIADFMRPVIVSLEKVHNEARAASLIYVAFLDVGENPTTESVQNLEDLILSLDKLIIRVVSGGGGEGNVV